MLTLALESMPKGFLHRTIKIGLWQLAKLLNWERQLFGIGSRAEINIRAKVNISGAHLIVGELAIDALQPRVRGQQRVA